MPLTYLSHQVPVVGMKLARPKWFDGVALALGSMSPDWLHGIKANSYDTSHSFTGTLAWGLPITLAATALVRWRLADVAGAHLPDCGRMRLRSWRALGLRSHRWWITVISAWLGAGSHVAIDAFTHRRGWGAQALGWDRHAVTVFDRHLTIAEVLQLNGHVFGIIAGLALLGMIGRRRLVEEWHGAARVARLRAGLPSFAGRVMFWGFTVIGAVIAGMLRHHKAFSMPIGAGVGMLIASFVPVCRAVAERRSDTDLELVPTIG